MENNPQIRFSPTLLDRLCMEIEEAWDIKKDYQKASELIQEHPEFRNELIDFLEYLIRAEMGQTSSAESELHAQEHAIEKIRANGDEALARRLETEWFLPPQGGENSSQPERATANDPSSTQAPLSREKDDVEDKRLEQPWKSYSEYVRSCSGLDPRSVAKTHGLTMWMLKQISRNAKDVGGLVQEEIARRGTENAGIDFETGLRLLQRSSPKASFARAASRNEEYESEYSFSFEDLVNQSPLPKEEKSFWLRLHKQSERQ